jgi:hypothetical protein
LVGVAASEAVVVGVWGFLHGDVRILLWHFGEFLTGPLIIRLGIAVEAVLEAVEAAVKKIF